MWNHNNHQDPLFLSDKPCHPKRWRFGWCLVFECASQWIHLSLEIILSCQISMIYNNSNKNLIRSLQLYSSLSLHIFLTPIVFLPWHMIFTCALPRMNTCEMHVNCWWERTFWMMCTQAWCELSIALSSTVLLTPTRAAGGSPVFPTLMRDSKVSNAPESVLYGQAHHLLNLRKTRRCVISEPLDPSSTGFMWISL